MEHYEVEYAGQEPHFCDLLEVGDYARRNGSSNARRAAEEAVRKWKLRGKYGERATCKVTVKQLALVQGKPRVANRFTVDVELPAEPMTEDLYNAEIAKVLAPLPPVFRAFVSLQAWEDGHASGYEEVLNIARCLTDRLVPAVKQYTEELTQKRKKPHGK